MALLFTVLAYFVASGLVLCADQEEYAAEELNGMVTSTTDDVLVLTEENFNSEVMSKSIILVEFYAPWCGHCKHLAPEYAKAAKILKNEDPSIPLGKVDATVETDLATRYEVTGYPTLFVFKDGEKFPYDGPRSSLGIVEYMKKFADPNWKPPPDAVLVLTNENFTDAVNSAEIILVEFYAPWCGHCKRLAPEYERAAKVLRDLPKPVHLAKVDATVEKELADKYQATGYPTLIIFRNGKRYNYNGPRDETGIISYMKEQAKNPSEKASSVILRKSVLTDITVVGFFTSESDPLYTSYIESANFMRGKFNFYHVFDPETSAKHGSKIAFYQPKIYSSDYESSEYLFTEDDGTVDDIKRFYKAHVVPLVGERSRKHEWKYQDLYPLVVVYYDVNFSFEHRVQTQLIRKEVAEVAKDYKGKITFAVSNEEEYQNELVDLRLDDSAEDVNVAYFASPVVRYRMEPVEDFSADELRDFVLNVQTGNIARHIKSQPPPIENKGPVITVVGSTFEKLVSNADKDILIEFYAPWCGHCKKLEPIYKKLGKMFHKNKRIVICKMDATANDVPEQFNVQGFPTIYYIPASDKSNIILYEGNRSLDDLEEFLNEQLSKGGVKEEL